MTERIIHGDGGNQVVKSFICVFKQHEKRYFLIFFVTRKNTYSLSCNSRYGFILSSFSQTVVDFSRPIKDLAYLSPGSKPRMGTTRGDIAGG